MEINYIQFMKILFVLLLLTSNLYGQVKLILPGEHLGFKLISDSSEVSIAQNEVWLAIYSDSNRFSTSQESLYWNENENFEIKSDSIIQPLFYIQGLEYISNSGYCIIGNFKKLDEFSHQKISKDVIKKFGQFAVLWIGDLNHDGRFEYLIQSYNDHDLVQYDFIIIDDNQKNKIKVAASFIEWI